MNIGLSLPAILAATVLQMILGMIWYGPLFGKQWMALTGMTEAKGKQGMKRGMIIGLFASFVFAFVIAGLLEATGVSSVMYAVKLAAVVWLGFSVTPELHGIAWEQRPVKLMWINVAYALVNTVVVAVVLQSWSF